MKAVLLSGYGDVDQLQYGEAADPVPGAGEVLVRTIATSVNPIDYKLRRGDMKSTMPLEFPAILGRDMVGEVIALGEGVTALSNGQIVFGLVNHAYAELVACRASDLAQLPHGMNAVDAAALPLITLTGTQLIEQGVQPQAGQRVLITGALGSVGRTAVHVAKQHGATVIAGVRAGEVSQARGLEADFIVAMDDENAVAQLPEVDAIADTVGGEVIASLLPRLKPGGVLATVLGKPASADGRPIRVAQVWAHPAPDRLIELARDVQQGKYVIPIGAHFSLADIRDAQRAAEKGGIGKIVATP